MPKKDPNRREQICKAIMEGIFSAEYMPGQILNEQALIEKFGCSKTLVREALISLCNNGVLKSIPRYGYEVVRLTREDVEEMIQFRYILEGGLMLSFIDTVTPEQIAQLRSINAHSAAQGDIWKHWENNSSFHLQLLSYSQNSCAYEELKRVLEKLKRAFAQFYWEKWHTSYGIIETDNHSRIIDCLEEHNARKLLDVLRTDLTSFGNLYFQIPDVFARAERDIKI